MKRMKPQHIAAANALTLLATGTRADQTEEQLRHHVEAI